MRVHGGFYFEGSPFENPEHFWPSTGWRVRWGSRNTTPYNVKYVFNVNERYRIDRPKYLDFSVYCDRPDPD